MKSLSRLLRTRAIGSLHKMMTSTWARRICRCLPPPLQKVQYSRTEEHPLDSPSEDPPSLEPCQNLAQSNRRSLQESDLWSSRMSFLKRDPLKLHDQFLCDVDVEAVLSALCSDPSCSNRKCLRISFHQPIIIMLPPERGTAIPTRAIRSFESIVDRKLKTCMFQSFFSELQL